MANISCCEHRLPKLKKPLPEHHINLDITFVCVYSLEFFFRDHNVSLFKKKQKQKPPLIQAAFQCFVVAKAYCGKRLRI